MSTTASACRVADLGSAKKVIVGKDDCTIVEGAGKAKDTKARMEEYEKGTWGLYDAVHEIKRLKEQNRRDQFVQGEARKKLAKEEEAVARLYSENMFLRQKAGIPEDNLIDHSQLNIEIQLGETVAEGAEAQA